MTPAVILAMFGIVDIGNGWAGTLNFNDVSGFVLSGSFICALLAAWRWRSQQHEVIARAADTIVHGADEMIENLREDNSILRHERDELRAHIKALEERCGELEARLAAR